MIEHNGKKYYTTYEIADLITDESTELHKKWKLLYPNWDSVILLEQVNRVLYTAKNNKEVSFVEFTRGEKGKKKYLAFLIDDVFTYINKKHASNMKFIDKE